MVYVGQAERGLRNKFADLYNGINLSSGAFAKIYLHRDELEVQWIFGDTIPLLIDIDKYWIKEFKPEWNLPEKDILKYGHAYAFLFLIILDNMPIKFM